MNQEMVYKISVQKQFPGNFIHTGGIHIKEHTINETKRYGTLSGDIERNQLIGIL